MKAIVKWMGDAQFIVENTRHLNLAVTDSKYRAESGEPTSIDLIIMGFAGCIYSEFRKVAESRRIPFDQFGTELFLEFYGDQSKPITMKVDLKTKSRIKSDLVRECLKQAVNNSMPGLLLSGAGITIESDVTVNHSSEVLFF